MEIKGDKNLIKFVESLEYMGVPLFPRVSMIQSLEIQELRKLLRNKDEEIKQLKNER